MSEQRLQKDSILQNYTIRSVLGQGSFGITYLAQDNNLHMKVAIKEFFPGAFVHRGAGGPFQSSFFGTSSELFRSQSYRLHGDAL